MTQNINRKHTRFEPDENTLITIYVNDSTVLVGLAISEAYGGCAGVFINNKHTPKIKDKDIYPLTVGQIKYNQAQVRWINKVDDDVIKIGFEVLD